MTTILRIYNEDGHVSEWWANFLKYASSEFPNINVGWFPERQCIKRFRGTLLKNTPVIDFDTEEDLAIFLLKFA